MGVLSLWYGILTTDTNPLICRLLQINLLGAEER